MLSELVGYARAQIAASARQAARPAAFALVGALFILFAVAGLFTALFFWLEPDQGPIAAALICAGVALLLAAIAVLPIAFKPKPPPPPKDNDMLPRFVTLMARTAPELGARKLLLTAALVGVALILSSPRGGEKRRR